jgi:hypothetical protein
VPTAPREFTIQGTWIISDPRLGSQIGSQITSITLSGNGEYKGGSWGRSFGGPNPLSANQYRYEDGVLSFFYIGPGQPKQQPDLLAGMVHMLSPTQFEFTVTGGLYGEGRNLGFQFLFTKPSLTTAPR